MAYRCHNLKGLKKNTQLIGKEIRTNLSYSLRFYKQSVNNPYMCQIRQISDMKCNQTECKQTMNMLISKFTFLMGNNSMIQNGCGNALTSGDNMYVHEQHDQSSCILCLELGIPSWYSYQLLN